MFDRIVVYFLTEPRRLENLGSTLASIGAAIVLAGLFGHFAVIATSAVGGLSGQLHSMKSLAEIYPSVPTWWIPEGVLSGLPAVFLAATGAWLNEVGKRIRRLLVVNSY